MDASELLFFESNQTHFQIEVFHSEWIHFNQPRIVKEWIATLEMDQSLKFSQLNGGEKKISSNWSGRNFFHFFEGSPALQSLYDDWIHNFVMQNVGRWWQIRLKSTGSVSLDDNLNLKWQKLKRGFRMGRIGSFIDQSTDTTRQSFIRILPDFSGFLNIF